MTYEQFQSRMIGRLRNKDLWNISGLTEAEHYAINAYNHSWLASMAPPEYKSVFGFEVTANFFDCDNLVSTHQLQSLQSFYLQKTPIEDGSIVWTLPFEGFGQFPNRVMAKIATQFPTMFRIEMGKPESVVHMQQSFKGASNSKFSLGRYYRKFENATSVRLVKSRKEHDELSAKLWVQNMDRFKELYSFYPYASSPYLCPHQEFLNRRLDNSSDMPDIEALKILCVEHRDTGDLIALVYYSIDEYDVVHWERTLRTFDPKYESMKVGICSTLMLMDLFHEYTINLGFEMAYKVHHYSQVNDFWTYERKLSPNLVRVTL